MSAERVIPGRFFVRECTTVTVASLPFLHEEKRERFADDHAPPKHDDMRAADLDSALPEQAQTTQRRARHKPGRVAERELRDVHRMKTVDIFRRIERADDGRFIDLLRRRRLDEDAVNRRIAIQFLDAREEIGLRGVGRQFQLHRMQSQLAAHFVLRPDVSARSRIIAHQHDRESGRDPACLQRFNFAAQFRVNFFGYCTTVDQFRS